MDVSSLENPYGDDKVHDACGLFGMMDVEGRRFSSEKPLQAMKNMHFRGNGLGAGFAVYGLYPEHKNCYALHIMYLSQEDRLKTEELMKDNFQIQYQEEVSCRSGFVINPPDIHRYFVIPPDMTHIPNDDYVIENVMKINRNIGGSFVLSSGKDMAVFKGVGYPEDIAEYYKLETYEGYMWIAHTRFPTNTPGWWGGAHPFNILDWSVIHNGELSSYGANQRWLEMFCYNCTMQTDTEVLAYTFDLLMRRQRLPIEVVAKILAPYFWVEIEEMQPKKRMLHRALRQSYGGLMMNGPFTVIVAHHGEMIGLVDRVKLRPLTAGIKGSMIFLSSEEAAIRAISPKLEKSWNPRGGEPVVARLVKRVEEVLV